MNKELKCKICGDFIEEDNPTDICYSCQSIMSNMNLGSK
jgi:Zn finger protein HypA/HybF involved in hydrogenase expression